MKLVYVKAYYKPVLQGISQCLSYTNKTMSEYNLVVIN